MRRWGILLALLFATAVIALGVAWFSPFQTAPLPKAMSHQVLPSGLHQYGIEGIYFDRTGWNPERLEESLKSRIPACVGVKINERHDSIVITTSKKIPDLPKLMDELAHGGGMFPCWEELCMREERSDSFNPNLYGLVFEKEILFSFPAVWMFKVAKTDAGCLKFSLYSAAVQKNGKTFFIEYALRYKDKKYFLESDGKHVECDWPKSEDVRGEAAGPSALRYAKAMTGVVKFNKTTALCMDYSRYAMRIFDQNSRFIWEDLDHIYGGFRTAVFDFQGDGVDEIVVLREDHGKVALLVFGSVAAGLGASPRPVSDMELFTNPVRLTLGRQNWGQTDRKEIAIENPKAIADIIGKVVLTATTLPSCEYTEWMTVETQNATFKVEFCEHSMSVVRGRKVSRYAMPPPLFESIRRFYQSQGVVLQTEKFEIPAKALPMSLEREKRRVPEDVPYQDFCNVGLTVRNTTDARVMVFPKYTFYAARDGKVVILMTVEAYQGEEMSLGGHTGCSVSVPGPPSPGKWELFAVRSHSAKVYQSYLAAGGTPLLTGLCPTRQRKALPKVCTESTFSNGVEVVFTRGGLSFVESLRKHGQYYHADYATPCDDPRKAPKAGP